jgi:hypothetical protein
MIMNGFPCPSTGKVFMIMERPLEERRWLFIIKRERRNELRAVVADVAHEGRNRVRLQPPRRGRCEKTAQHLGFSHGWIEPLSVPISSHEQRHPIMQVAECVLGDRGEHSARPQQRIRIVKWFRSVMPDLIQTSHCEHATISGPNKEGLPTAAYGAEPLVVPVGGE